jgi:hypothetical protein
MLFHQFSHGFPATGRRYAPSRLGAGVWPVAPGQEAAAATHPRGGRAIFAAREGSRGVGKPMGKPQENHRNREISWDL